MTTIAFHSYGKRSYVLLLERLEFPDNQASEFTHDECFNSPLMPFLQILDDRFRFFALISSVSPQKCLLFTFGGKAPHFVNAATSIRAEKRQVFLSKQATSTESEQDPQKWW